MSKASNAIELDERHQEGAALMVEWRDLKRRTSQWLDGKKKPTTHYDPADELRSVMSEAIIKEMEARFSVKK